VATSLTPSPVAATRSRRAVRLRRTRKQPVSAAVGLRVKTGWAVAVLIGGPTRAPRILDRRRIELSDPDEPDSRQPFHAGTGTARVDPAEVRRLVAGIGRRTRRSLSALLRGYDAAGFRPRAMLLVVGSLADPLSISNPHIRAHAQEGYLYRTLLEQESRRLGIRTTAIRDRDLLPGVAAALGISSARIRTALRRMGKDVGSPWGANERAAALAAWLALVSGRTRGSSPPGRSPAERGARSWPARPPRSR
jgi:hypothetical protein